MYLNLKKEEGGLIVYPKNFLEEICGDDVRKSIHASELFYSSNATFEMCDDLRPFIVSIILSTINFIHGRMTFPIVETI